MPYVWSSQGAVLATAVAVSGTVIMLFLSREKTTLTRIQDLGRSAKTRLVTRSCLSSGKKNGGNRKKVRFSSEVFLVVAIWQMVMGRIAWVRVQINKLKLFYIQLIY
ncbi:hypothetical protein LXL04_002010 [Taraxacum kok-saghyz]